MTETLTNMAQFKYTDIHIFNKAGNELPLVFDTSFKVTLPNRFKDNAVFYGVLNPDNTIAGFHKHCAGGRYDSATNMNASLLLNGRAASSQVQVVKSKNKTFSSYSGATDEYSIDEVLSVAESHIPYGVEFPSVTFATGITFSTISTNLIETESLYVLIEEDGVFKKFVDSDNESVAEWASRYKLLFFIDTRKQEDFRFFDATDDEIVWSNKKILDIDEGGYRVDVGFVGKEEGVYEEQVIVCLLDTHNPDEELPGAIYPIGTIRLNAEAVGEDERYRALFTNFGIPHPEEYMNIFADSDLNEGFVDNIAMNKNAKRMFLSYNEIFPYVGTYKALVNAVNVLGYTDVFFKEWYKETGKTTSAKNVSYDISYKSENPINTINSVSLDERISLKKLNWLSMVYKINEELSSSGFDQYGFPETIKVHGYNNSEIVVKLIALKDWLEKYIIGLNCRIIDVGGEGVYFERVRLDSYGSYQNIIEWNNEFNIAPYVVETEDANVLYDTSAYIKVNVGLNDSLLSLEDIQGKMIQEYCQGYIDDAGKYHEIKPSTVDSDGIIFVGGTLGCLETLETVELKASSSTNTFLFGDDYMYVPCVDSSTSDSSTDSSIDASSDLVLKATIGATTEGATEGDTSTDSSIIGESATAILPGMSCSLRLEENELIFSPLDLYNGKRKQTIFKKCPIILLERANIRKASPTWKNSVIYSILPDLRENTLESFIIKNHRNGETQSTIDYVTMVPPTIVEDSSSQIVLKPYNTNDTISIVPEELPDVIAEEENPKAYYNVLNAHYGLKYSAENALNIPMFSILGYQIDKIDKNISKSEEYLLEIIDGKMMFQDDENDRVIYLNFNFDSDSNEQTVDVNIVYNSEDFNIVDYTDSSNNLFTHFSETGDYSSFAEAYLDNPEECIHHTFEHSVKVNNTGEFTVDVLGRDIHNNIFAANCDKKTTVIMPEIGITSYTNESTSKGLLNVSGSIADSSRLNDNFIDFCIYKHNFLIPDISVHSTDTTISVEYPTYSFGMYAPKHNDQLHFVDITDRFSIGALDYTYTKYKNLEGKSLFETFGMVGNPTSHKIFGKYVGANDVMAVTAMNNNVFTGNTNGAKTVSDYLEDFSSAPVNYSDINLIFYNELGGYPIMQTYAQMASDKAFSIDSSKYKGNYRIVANDESHKGYIWASIKDTIENDIVNDFATDIVSFMDLSNVWTYKEYYIESHTSDSSTETEEDSSVQDDVDIPTVILTNDDKVAYDLAKHFIDHIKSANNVAANNISVYECTNEYENWFVGENKFKEDLYICADASYMPEDFEDVSAAVETIVHDCSIIIDGEEKKLSLFYPYLITHVLDSSLYDTVIKYPFSIKNGEVVEGNLYFDVVTSYLSNCYTMLAPQLVSSAYNYISTCDMDGASILNAISSSLLDASAYLQADQDTVDLQKIFMKDEIDSSTGELKNTLNGFEIDDSSIIDITYTNLEEGVDYIKFRDMMSDYLNQPFDFNKIYLEICIKAVYDVLSKTTEITSKTFVDINDRIYTELTLLDDTFKAAGTSRLEIEDALNLSKTEKLYYDEKTGILPIAKILKNYMFATGAYLAYMSRTEPEDLDVAQMDLNYYINAMFMIYSYFAVSFALNIKNISDYVRYQYPSGSYQLSSDNIILYKYLTFTEYDIQSRSIVMMKAFVDSWTNTFLGESFIEHDTIISDENVESEEVKEPEFITSLLYKYATAEVVDAESYKRYLISYTPNDTIGIYNKIVTNYAYDKFEEIAKRNWVTMGKVHPSVIVQCGMTKKIDSSIINDSSVINTDINALYAVVSDIDMSWKDASLICLNCPNSFLEQIEEKEELDAWHKDSSTSEDSNNLENIEDVLGDSEDGDTDNGMFYVKLPGYTNDGYKEVTTGIPGNFTIKIDDILASNYITTYVKPAWRAEVKIGVIDPTEEMYDKLDPNEQYLYASYRDSNFNPSFRIGEIVKIIFESVNTDEYIGQSSYEVVGFDILNRGVILKGNINKDYLNTKEEEVWARLDTVSKPYIPKGDSSIEGEKADIAGKLNPSEFAVIGYELDADGIMHAVARKIIRENTSYIIINPSIGKDDNGTPKYESAIVPIKYEVNFDTSSGETSGNWYYRVHTVFGSSRGIYPVNITSSVSEKVNMYISYSHISYVDYKMKVLDSVELPTGITRVNIESTPMNHRILDFIDDTFSVNVSRFDINEGITNWMNSRKLSTSINDAVPAITDDASLMVYEYNNTPVELHEHRNVAFGVNFENTGIDASTSYVNWKVYKADEISANRKLLFESYNPMLFLDTQTPGIYDIEAIVYDKFGNSTSRLFKGAYKIV